MAVVTNPEIKRGNDSLRSASKVRASEVIEWLRKYIRKIDVFGFSVELRTPATSSGGEAEVEVLPQLQRKFGRRLRPDLTSVTFCQGSSRCFLRVTTGGLIARCLQNQVTIKEDLGFINDETNGDGLYFSPDLSVGQSVQRFLRDFDEVLIINCTDLFTDDAVA